METIRRISNAVSRVLQRVEMFVGCSCLALMLALMLTNAIARYLFDFPIVWSDELNNFFFVWLGFMACAYIMGNDSHMSVTGLVSLLPRRSKYIETRDIFRSAAHPAQICLFHSAYQLCVDDCAYC